MASDDDAQPLDEQPPPLLGALLITGSSTMTLLKCWC